MYGYIYKTINLINNKLYVGKHKGEFDSNYFGSGKYLNNSIDKHGKNNFKLEILVYAEDKNKLDELEKKYIAEYRALFGKENLYNIANGGEGFSGKHTEEAVKNIRLGNIGKNVGKVRSQESKEKNRLAHIGKPNKMKGKKFPPEFCKKISLAMTGKKRGKYNRIIKKLSLETREKMRLAHLGKKRKN